tara:strand:+ start:36572 stop:37033 length:462 start_codon:yes stop_codon:yes gene_type:complete
MRWIRLTRLWLVNKYKTKRNDKISELKQEIEILKNISVLSHRRWFNILFYLSMVLQFTSLVCIVSFFIIGATHIIFKALAVSTFLILIPILIFLYKMLFGNTTLHMCSYCRRIKYRERYVILEEFLGKLSHDLCEHCGKPDNSVGMKEKHRGE